MFMKVEKLLYACWNSELVILTMDFHIYVYHLFVLWKAEF